MERVKRAHIIFSHDWGAEHRAQGGSCHPAGAAHGNDNRAISPSILANMELHEA